MDQNNITPDTIPFGGEGAVEDVVQAPEGDATPTESPKGEKPSDALSLKEINEFLGKNFKDTATALKALKDTQSYVGKKEADVERDLREKGFLTRAELENELFFRDNPAHAENKDILEAIAAKNNLSLKDAVKHETYSRLYEGASKYEETKATKSVLESSPRLRQVAEKSESIKQLKNEGNVDAAREEAARLVADAYGL